MPKEDVIFEPPTGPINDCIGWTVPAEVLGSVRTSSMIGTVRPAPRRQGELRASMRDRRSARRGYPEFVDEQYEG